MGSMIDFKRPDGSSCKGYLAEAGKGKPGIVVIQEWWGLVTRSKASLIASPPRAITPAPDPTRAA
jgi:dienelactone hydrolase